MYFDQNMIIDATRGSIARFVNHACEPNCRMEKWTVAGKPRMALFAGDRGVSTGEELSYDYNFEWVSWAVLKPSYYVLTLCQSILQQECARVPLRISELSRILGSTSEG